MVVLDLDFSQAAQEVYNNNSEEYLKKLVMPDANDPESRLIINANSYRALVLMSVWPLFAYAPFVIKQQADATKWPVGRSLLRKLLKTIHSHTIGCQYVPTVPNSDDVAGLLAEFFKYSPRLAAFCANVADQVIKRKQKAIVWVLYPVEQLLLAAILQMMGIDARGFLSTARITKTSSIRVIARSRS